jgi:hypothetical protein
VAAPSRKLPESLPPMDNNLHTATDAGHRILQRAQTLVDQARELDKAGQRSAAEQCRRKAHATLLYHALLVDSERPPNQWLLENLLRAQQATERHRSEKSAA